MCRKPIHIFRYSSDCIFKECIKIYVCRNNNKNIIMSMQVYLNNPWNINLKNKEFEWKRMSSYFPFHHSRSVALVTIKLWALNGKKISHAIETFLFCFRLISVQFSRHIIMCQKFFLYKFFFISISNAILSTPVCNNKFIRRIH